MCLYLYLRSCYNGIMKGGVEKLVDEICARNDNMYVAIKELRQATGMDLGSADDIIRKKYKGVTRQEERKRSKQKRGRFHL